MLAAKVESKNGTVDPIARNAKSLERVFPEPPKRDFTLALSGEFNDISYWLLDFWPIGYLMG
jgi:hypothetical protein